MRGHAFLLGRQWRDIADARKLAAGNLRGDFDKSLQEIGSKMLEWFEKVSKIHFGEKSTFDHFNTNDGKVRIYAYVNNELECVDTLSAEWLAAEDSFV